MHPELRRLLAGAAVLAVVGVAALRLSESRAAVERQDALHRLPPAHAVGVELDTLLVGGYAHGSYTEAMQVLASDLTDEERALVGQHLDRIFGGVAETAGLGRAGRLRVAYERALRPDGTTRSIRVLAAEAAVGGKMHTALFYERAGKPGYFDFFGHSLDPDAWTGPLANARVSSPYGLGRMHPILRRVLPHTGVDYAASAGTEVRATGDGIVSVAERRGGYGNLVEIQHPSGYSTRYAHLSRVSVARGRFVRQGEVVGAVGMTGLATGPHLHYELRRQGRPVDPERVAANSGVAADVGGETGWAGSRRFLSHLLGRTPAVLGGEAGES